MATFYNTLEITKGVNGFGSPFSDTIYSATLPANTDTTITVPSSSANGFPSATHNKYLAVFSYESAKEVYVANNATAAKPAGSTFAATTSELLPPAKLVKAGDVLHLLAATASSDVTVAFYSVQD